MRRHGVSRPRVTAWMRRTWSWDSLLGSFGDDLLGSSAAVGVLQVVRWIASGVLVIGALAASRGRRHARPGGLRPTAP